MANRNFSIDISSPTDPSEEGDERADEVMANHDHALGEEVATGHRLDNDNNAQRDLANPERPWDPDADPFFTTTSYSPTASYPPTSTRYFTDGTQDEDSDHVMQDTMAAPNQQPAHSPRAQPGYDEPFLTLTKTESAAMETILEPVRDKLIALKRTTEESLPQYHPNTKANTHAQVLKTRLDGIAKHIMQHLTRVAESGRGREELRLCRYIADVYWPLPVTTTTHLDIFRIYRNRLARQALNQVPRAQIEAAQAQHEAWAQDVASRRRGTFGEAAARLAGRRQSDNMVRMVEEEERQKQVERDAELARELSEQLNSESGDVNNTIKHSDNVDDPGRVFDVGSIGTLFDCETPIWQEGEEQDTFRLPPAIYQDGDLEEAEYDGDDRLSESFAWQFEEIQARQIAADAEAARRLQTQFDSESQDTPPVPPLHESSRRLQSMLDDRIMAEGFARQEALDESQRMPHTRSGNAREESLNGNRGDTNPQAAIRPFAPATFRHSNNKVRFNTIIEEEKDDDHEDGA